MTQDEVRQYEFSLFVDDSSSLGHLTPNEFVAQRQDKETIVDVVWVTSHSTRRTEVNLSFRQVLLQC